MQKTKFKIEGMHCTSCAMNIDFDLEDLKGIKKAQTNYASATLEVEFDPKELTLQEIVEQVKKTGYQIKKID